MVGEGSVSLGLLDVVWGGEEGERGGDVLRSLAQWSRASLSVLSKRRGPKKGGTQKMDVLLCLWGGWLLC